MPDISMADPQARTTAGPRLDFQEHLADLESGGRERLRTSINVRSCARTFHTDPRRAPCVDRRRLDGVTGKKLSNPILVLRVDWALAVWSVATRERLDVVRDEAVTF